MSLIRTTFILAGAFAGQTIKLGSQPYPFVEGRLEITDTPDQIALHARFLERNWQAYPEGHPALEETTNGERTVQENPKPDEQHPVSGDGQPSGSGAEASAAVAVSEVAAGTEAGQAGGDANGNGPAAELNEKLQKAVLGLDPEDDSHWTREGKPAMTAVEKLYGSSGITRADVEAAAPGHTRTAAKAGA